MEIDNYINALRKCAKEHENDRTFTGHIVVSDLCRDTANLLEELEPFINKPCISSEVCEHDKNKALDKIDEIITDALDKSTDQKESQTLRWVLDKISEVEDGNVD